MSSAVYVISAPITKTKAIGPVKQNATQHFHVEVSTYRIAGNFGEVLIWRIGDFAENHQI